MTPRWTRRVLLLVLGLYLVLGTLYAVYTPAWQAPDEPAHYNYVRYLVDNGRFPVLHFGDYPHAYLEQIKAAKFPPDLSIDNIRYEFHQPPLYYALAAPVFAAFRQVPGPWATPAPGLLPLRLLSVLLGLPLVVLAYAITRRIFPAWPGLAVGTAAFVALLPRHLAAVAQAGNDTVAELLLALVLLILVNWLAADARGGTDPRPAAEGSVSPRDGTDAAGRATEYGAASVGEGAPAGRLAATGRDRLKPALQVAAPDRARPGNGTAGQAVLPPAAPSSPNSRYSPGPATQNAEPRTRSAPTRTLLVLGLLLGLIAITKTTAYFALALILAVLIWDWRRTQACVRRIAGDLCRVALPAALIAVPWYVRDISVYGWPDFLGLRMHDLVVAGQMRPADFLAQYGLAAYVQQLIVVTFESFWAVFGWQGVFLDVRIYEGLALLSAVVLGGLALHERQVRQPGALAPGQRYALRLLAACAFLALLTYAWYNTQFVQFQGRYLFTGLIPVAVAFGLGWDAAAARPRQAGLLAGALAALALLLAVAGLALGHSLPKWPVALALAGAALLACRAWLPVFSPRRAGPGPALAVGLLWALPYAALPLLALYCLFGAVVPQLR